MTLVLRLEDDGGMLPPDSKPAGATAAEDAQTLQAPCDRHLLRPPRTAASACAICASGWRRCTARAPRSI
jgi:hypothetical protein